jgi:lysosomal acid lipase/cholesteryl ester hydrolase
MDFLVLTDPLIDRLQTRETDVRLIRAKRQEEGEHCDHFWAAEAVEWCFWDILEDIESTRTLFPEEVSAGGRKSTGSNGTLVNEESESKNGKLVDLE